MVNKKPASTNVQLPLELGFADSACFDNFYHQANEELLQALKSTVSDSEPWLVYVYGPKGSGKSHLLYATLKLAQEQNLSAMFVGLSNPSLSPEMIEALDTQNLICIDDVNQWSGQIEAERALFALFEKIRSSKGKLIVSSSQSPEDSGFELKDLVSRLGSGLVYSVQPLDDEQQHHAIKLRAKQKGLTISEDAITFLLRRTSRDTTELFKILDEIDRVSLIEKRRITIPFLREKLAI